MIKKHPVRNVCNESEHFGVKLELRLSRGGIVSSGVLEIRNWDMGHGKQEMGHWTWVGEDGKLT